MFNIKSSVLVTLVLMGSLGLASIYTIKEGQHGLLLRLGELKADSQGRPKVFVPGIHFKWPFINAAKIFDTRLQTLDGKTSRIVTVLKKDVKVDYYVKWRITNLPVYYTSTGGNPIQAETLLEQKINDSLRAEFGKRDISEVVSDDRSEIMNALRNEVAQGSQDLGIEVLDVRIKRIDLPEEVSNSIFERMRAERGQVANKHRADGRAVAQEIRSTADKNASIIVATAYKESETIRGQGDAQAADIYATAYGKNKDFFRLYKSLGAYTQSFSKKSDVLVLQPDSDFFRYFNRVKPKV